jgi:hypothetical protein
MLGSRGDVQKLGWTNFTKFVKAACDADVLELIETDPGSKFLALLPTSPESTMSNGLSQVISRSPIGFHSLTLFEHTGPW